ncbi:TMLHE [Branchiostoma lanceolatum]|uniref:Trimethyllysine dioxygenase, mitochondrial n=1 Tax=Branchiostoma lanceolatum TaxID=7740 RepID=A0A8J9YY72_BRALA|nr:TMLHE [Branchiostoma lanceolatum]
MTLTMAKHNVYQVPDHSRLPDTYSHTPPPPSTYPLAALSPEGLGACANTIIPPLSNQLRTKLYQNDLKVFTGSTMYLRRLASFSGRISQGLSAARKSAAGLLVSQSARLQDRQLPRWLAPTTSRSFSSTFPGEERETRAAAVTVPTAEFLEFEDHLILKYKGVKLMLNYVWLRDHCRTGVNHLTGEHLVDSVTIDPNIQPVNVTVEEVTLGITCKYCRNDRERAESYMRQSASRDRAERYVRQGRALRATGQRAMCDRAERYVRHSSRALRATGQSATCDRAERYVRQGRALRATEQRATCDRAESYVRQSASRDRAESYVRQSKALRVPKHVTNDLKVFTGSAMYLRRLASFSGRITQSLSAARKSAAGLLASRSARLQDRKLPRWLAPTTSRSFCSTFPGEERETRAAEAHVPTAEFLEFEDHLILKYKGVKLMLNYVWLRDHCRRESLCNSNFVPTQQVRASTVLYLLEKAPCMLHFYCFTFTFICRTGVNHLTGEHLVDSVTIDPNIQPVKVTVEEVTLGITWPDGHQSEYGLDWLLSNTYEGKKHVGGSLEPFLWDAAALSASPPPRVLYQDYLADDRQLAKVLHTLMKYGFAFVEEAPVSMEATLAVAERISHVRETFFGKHWFVTSDFERHDTGYTTAALPVHTDNTHFNEPTGLIVTQMLEEGDSGGTSLLVDGFHAAERLRREDPEGFAVLSSLSVPHHFLEPFLHTTGVGPVVELEPGSRRELKMIRYCQYDRAVLDTIPMEDVGRWYAALRNFTKYIRDPSNEYWIQLKPGQVLLIYNWRVLHGRSAYEGHQRKLGGYYMPRDDFFSKARILKVI